MRDRSTATRSDTPCVVVAPGCRWMNSAVVEGLECLEGRAVGSPGSGMKARRRRRGCEIGTARRPLRLRAGGIAAGARLQVVVIERRERVRRRGRRDGVVHRVLRGYREAQRGRPGRTLVSR